MEQTRDCLPIVLTGRVGVGPELACGLVIGPAFTKGGNDGLHDAEPYLAEALEGSRRILGDDHVQTLQSIDSIGHLLQDQGRLAEAEPFSAEALAGLRRVLGDDHLLTLVSTNNMGVLLRDQGRLYDAEPYFAEALARQRRVRGDDHPETLTSINNMGSLLWSQGRLAEAEPYFAEALAGRRRVLGDDHRATLVSINDMGRLLQSQGRLAEAGAYYAEALAGRRRVLAKDHPDTPRTIDNMGLLLQSQGRLYDAEPYFAEALAGHRRVLGDDHPTTLMSINHMGSLLRAQGRLAEAEPYFAEALAVAERLRIDVVGGARERAAFAKRLKLLDIAARYAALLANTERAAMALSIIERGRGRAALDLLSSRSSGGLDAALRTIGDPARIARYEDATNRERDAMVALREAEAQMAAARNDEVKAELNELVKLRRRELGERTREVFGELHGLFPITEPLTSDRLVGSLTPGEALVSFVWTRDRVLALVATERGVESVTIAGDQEGEEEARAAAKALREAVSTRPVGPLDSAILESARRALAPDELRSLLADAESITVVPDGPLHTLPMELLLPDVPIAYAPSATIALDHRRVARQRLTSLAGAVVLGNPDFGGEIVEPEYPETGVLLSKVTEDSNADIGGLRRRDVLLRYGEHQLALLRDLRPAIQETAEALTTRGVEPDARPVSVTVWRDGETLEVALAPGAMGVIPSRAPPAEGLRAMAFFDRSADQQSAVASSLDQYRLYGDSLTPLPGTQREAMSIGALMKKGGHSTKLLVGEEASAPNLAGAVLASPPRFLHLATHGLTGNADRPEEASLALTKPDEPTADDMGFLTLEEIIKRWPGRLAGTELVTLSACDTGLGVARGDSVMSLPLGFFAAGAETVVASLWKVDDSATTRLMTRMYENLLGVYEDRREVGQNGYGGGKAMTKIDALREAQLWLRGLTVEQVRALEDELATLASTGDDTRGPIRPRNVPANAQLVHPYEHPYFWAAFVLIGDPE